MKKNIIFLNRVLAAVPGGSGGNSNQGVDFKSVAGGDGPEFGFTPGIDNDMNHLA